ncbi:MAG: DegT/DnrJ/EryC1/StrS family aminotransferase [Chloroflexi bacterium]|nr:DegT/DnrJ/EryC1/StrS family aminotransferase [Chloroflexota bacterium]
MIRLTIPSIEEDDLQAVREVLASGYLVQGPRVAAFEQAVADYVGTKYAVAVSNCTAALHLALLALDTRLGDLVIVTAYSFIATANVIELCGAQPVFVDIQPNTFNLDPNCLEEVLKQLMSAKETGRRVKAILPVHTFGQMADMPAILELAERYGLPVIEDAACALGATLHGRQAGTWGMMGCFSFHPRKAITTGEGGIITTNDSDLARRLRALRNHGQDPDAAAPDFILPGFNYRMTEFQAALGITQMTKLDQIIAARRRLAACYDTLLANTPLRPPIVSPGSQPVYQSYVILLPEDSAPRRADLIRNLKDRGIETTIGTWHMPMTTYFRSRYDYRLGDFPVADAVFARSVTLPLFEKMQEGQQAEVVQQILSVIQDGG